MDSKQEEQEATCSRKTVMLEHWPWNRLPGVVMESPSLEGRCSCGTWGHSLVIVLGSAGGFSDLNDSVNSD